MVEVIVVGSRDSAKTVSDAVFQELRRVEDLTSFHKDSPLSRLNAAAGTGPVRVDEELFGLIKDSIRIAGQTGGAFDPTVGPLTSLWNFSGTEARSEPLVPSGDQIDAAREKMGWKKVALDPEKLSVILPETGMALDLGGIAKGYALERAREVIKRHGNPAVLVNAGGDILAMGEKEPGQPWRVGVQDPRNPRGLIATASIKDKIVVTSGDYERFFVHNGKRYHHLLDPKTGYPTQGLQSATIVAPDGVMADALATAVFPMGLEAAMKFIESLPGVAALFVDADGSMHFSSLARSLLEPVR